MPTQILVEMTPVYEYYENEIQNKPSPYNRNSINERANALFQRLQQIQPHLPYVISQILILDPAAKLISNKLESDNKLFGGTMSEIREAVLKETDTDVVHNPNAATQVMLINKNEDIFIKRKEIIVKNAKSYNIGVITNNTDYHKETKSNKRGLSY